MKHLRSSLLLCLLLAACRTPGPAPTPVGGRIIGLMGGLPAEKTPLNARITGRLERDGYRVEKLLFESQPGFRVTANLYVPTRGAGPFPAVLGTSGHSDLAKTYASYQTVWITLARRGFVVLAYDPPNQGERFEFLDPATGKTRIGAGVPGHIQAGLKCMLTGRTIASYFVWDGVRALDCLLARPEVDPRRIGVAGNSGGGTQAAYLAACEPRLAAAVSACYMTHWDNLFVKPGPQDMEQVIPGFLGAGLDFPDFIRAFGHKPFLIAAARRDFFPIEGARRTFEIAKRDGYPVEMAEVDEEHGWTRALREETYRFLEKHLAGAGNSAAEGEVVTEKPEDLRVTETGQLATSLGSETVSSLNAAHARALHARRQVVRGGDLRELVSKRTGVAWTPLPAVEKAPRELAIAWPDSLRFAESKQSYSPEYQAAARAWLKGSNLVSGQVDAVLRQVAAADGPVVIRARGRDAPAALLAAVLEPRIVRVIEEDGFESWLAATQDPMAVLPPALVLPGVLADFDLPDVRKCLSARSLKVYVFADMEGCTGITGSEQIGGSRAAEGKRLMVEDMNACIAGCFDAGATEVVVRDGHGGGTNVDPALLDPRAALIQGPTPGVRFKDLEGAQALILLGYHAKALTPGGVLAHSYSSASIQGMWLNGREVGEIGVDMAIAAEHKLPVVMVSGDDKTAAEARAWSPEVVTCETKKGTGPQSAVLVSPEGSRQRIRQQTADAVRRRHSMPLLKIDYPATMRWDYLPKDSLRTHHPDFKPVENPRRVEKTGDSVERLLLGG